MDELGLGSVSSIVLQPQSTKDRRGELLKQSMMRPGPVLGPGGSSSLLLNPFATRKAQADPVVVVMAPGVSREEKRNGGFLGTSTGNGTGTTTYSKYNPRKAVLHYAALCDSIYAFEWTVDSNM